MKLQGAFCKVILALLAEWLRDKPRSVQELPIIGRGSFTREMCEATLLNSLISSVPANQFITDYKRISPSVNYLKGKGS